MYNPKSVLKYNTFRWIALGSFVLFIILYYASNAIFLVGVILSILMYIGMVIWGSTHLSSQFFIPATCKLNNSSHIALSFDDGPIPGQTEKILDILKERNVRASFFCIGERMMRNPEIARRIYAEKHSLGNHSYFHKWWFPLQFSRSMVNELRCTEEIINKITGSPSIGFRPPFGVSNPMMARALQAVSIPVWGWSNKSWDTVVHDPEKLFQKVMKQLRGGDVILFHDDADGIIQILDRLILEIRQQGFEFVRLDEE